MAPTTDTISHNKKAWNLQAKKRLTYSTPVSPQEVNEARNGALTLFLTSDTPVPRRWFPPSFKGVDILGLASSGGQQMPLFAAAGANVTVIDFSIEQLDIDRQVADREGLALRTVEGDMRDLSCFEENSFDLIFHPISNCFIPDVRPVWREAFRVLRPGGVLLSGFINPVFYLFEYDKMEQGILEVAYKIPFSDTEQLPSDELASMKEECLALEFGHTLEDQIGGQLKAGFVLTDLFEDRWKDKKLGAHIPLCMATRALKPVSP